MARIRVVQAGMTVERVVWQAFARQDEQLVEQTLALNPGLSAAGPILAVGTEVTLPEPPSGRRSARDTVRLWS